MPKKAKRPPAPMPQPTSRSTPWLISLVPVLAVIVSVVAWQQQQPDTPTRRAVSPIASELLSNTPALGTVLTQDIDASDPLWRHMPIQQGMHVIERIDSAPPHPGASMRFRVYRHATNQTIHRKGIKPDTGPIDIAFAADSMAEFRRRLASMAGFHVAPEVAQGLKQVWQLYSADGEPLDRMPMDVIRELPIMIAMEGGKWVWPAVAVGFKRRVSIGQTGSAIELETLALRPLVLRVSPFLTDEEIELILGLASPHMADSPVSLMDHDKGKAATEWRTSSQYFLPSSAHPAISKIRTRAQQLLRVPLDHQENAIQVLRYREAEKYDAHNDYFDMSMYKSQTAMVKAYDHGWKNRLLTLFWYMSDVPEGGETQFPRAGGRRFNGNYAECQGLKVRPEKGSAVLFYSLTASGDLDDFSLHGGCPVLSKDTIKWAANQWVWNKRF